MVNAGIAHLGDQEIPTSSVSFSKTSSMKLGLIVQSRIGYRVRRKVSEVVVKA